jgi:hypothetical protein
MIFFFPIANKLRFLDVTGYLEAERNCMTCMQLHGAVERTCLCDLATDKDYFMVGPQRLICL